MTIAKLSDLFTLDRLLITGYSGGGKTWLLRQILLNSFFKEQNKDSVHELKELFNHYPKVLLIEEGMPNFLISQMATEAKITPEEVERVFYKNVTWINNYTNEENLKEALNKSMVHKYDLILVNLDLLENIKSGLQDLNLKGKQIVYSQSIREWDPKPGGSRVAFNLTLHSLMNHIVKIDFKEAKVEVIKSRSGRSGFSIFFKDYSFRP